MERDKVNEGKKKIVGKKERKVFGIGLLVVFFVVSAWMVFADGCFVEGYIFYKNGSPVANDTKYQLQIINHTDGQPVNDPQIPYINGTGPRSNTPEVNRYQNVQAITCTYSNDGDSSNDDIIRVRGWDINYSTSTSEANYTGSNTTDKITLNCTSSGIGEWTCKLNVTLTDLANPNVTIDANTTSETVTPGKNASYLLNITNLAGAADDFNITSNWTNATNLYLNETSVTNLSAGKSWFVEMDVNDGTDGLYTTNITVASLSNTSVTANISINTTVQTIPVYDVNISPNTTASQIYNDTNATYLLNITNIGNQMDNYTLYNNTNSSAARLNQTSVLNLEPQNWTLVELEVGNPEGAGQFQTNVTVVSDTDSDANDTATIETTVLEVPVRKVNVTANSTSEEIMNHSYAIYLINVTNIGNYPDNFTVSNVSNATSAEFNETSLLDVGVGESRYVTLNVSNPTWGYFETTVTATSQNDASGTDNLVVGTNVSEVLHANVSVTAVPLEQTVSNETNATYTVNITNTGNYPDSFNLTNSTNAIYAYLNQTTTPELWMGESYFVVLNVSNPTLGYFETNITAVSNNNGTVNDTEKVYTNVTQILLDVNLTADKYYEQIDAGQTAEYILNITNKGNVADTYTLTEDSNATTRIFNQSTTPSIDPGDSYFVRLSVIEGYPGIYETNVTAESDTDADINHTITVQTEVNNQPPNQPTVDVTPDTARTDDDLVCSVTTASVDNESQPISYYYEWYKNGALNLSTTNLSQTSHTLEAGNTTKGETWNCTVTPHDGHLNGTSDWDTVTVQNTVPTITVDMTPDNPSTIQNLTCSGIYNDADEDAPGTIDAEFTGDYTESTTANCVLISGGTYNCTANVSSANTTERDNITCTMTPNDGTVDGSSDSDWVEVAWVTGVSDFSVVLNKTDKESVIINWTASPNADSYAIYWSSNCTEMQELDAYHATPQDTTTKTTYTDMTAGSVEARYYRVAAVKSPAYELEPETGGKRNRSVSAGRNLISLPVLPESADIDDVVYPPAGSTYDRVTRYTPGTGWERTDYYGETWKWYGDFNNLELDRGYYMYPTKTQYTIPLAGIVEEGNRTVQIGAGRNLIGWTSQFPREINETLTPPTDEDRIATYIGGSGWERTDHYTGKGWYGDFDEFEPGYGYWFYPTGTGYTWEYDPCPI